MNTKIKICYQSVWSEPIQVELNSELLLNRKQDWIEQSKNFNGRQMNENTIIIDDLENFNSFVKSILEDLSSISKK